MKKELLKIEQDGKSCTLFAIQIRTDGTKQTGAGYLLHDDADEAGERDRISGGISGVEPTTPEEAANMIELASWTDDFRIDGNGYYIRTE